MPTNLDPDFTEQTFPASERETDEPPPPAASSPAVPPPAPSSPAVPPPAAKPGPELKPFLKWAEAHATADWLVKCAAVAERWPQGQEMTEVTYLAAINKAASVTAR